MAKNHPEVMSDVTESVLSASYAAARVSSRHAPIHRKHVLIFNNFLALLLNINLTLTAIFTSMLKQLSKNYL
jgi:hypothetical protein